MFGLFKRGGGGAAKPSLDAVRFDATGYVFQGEPQPGTRKEDRPRSRPVGEHRSG